MWLFLELHRSQAAGRGMWCKTHIGPFCFLLLLLQQIFRCIETVKNRNSWTQCLGVCNGALTFGCDFGGINDGQDPENRYLIRLKRKFLKTNWSCWLFSTLCCDWETLLRPDRSDVCCCWARGDSDVWNFVWSTLDAFVRHQHRYIHFY